MLKPFSQILRELRPDGGDLVVPMTADWMQGRSVFGGMQAAISVQAMRTVVPDLPLRTVQAVFVAPIVAGDLRVRAKVLRTGKSITHVEARFVDGETTLAIFYGLFGVARKSEVALMPPPAPVSREKAFTLPYVEGVTPIFTKHFVVRWLHGDFPYAGSRETRNVLEIDVNDAGPATEGHVIAIADFIPPIGLSHLTKPAPGSTLTWMIEFFDSDVGQFGLSNWRVDAEMVAARDGYTSQSVMVWSPDGSPVALSRQAMLVFG